MSLTNSGGKEQENFGTPRQLPPNPPQPPIPEAQMQSQPEPPQGELITVEECPYCGEPKQVKVWRETGEKVCLDCRRSLLEQEFENADKL